MARHHRSQAFTGSQSIRLLSFGRIDPGQTDFVFLIVGVEDVDGIAIRNLDDLAGGGVGGGR